LHHVISIYVQGAGFNYSQTHPQHRQCDQFIDLLRERSCKSFDYALICQSQTNKWENTRKDSNDYSTHSQ